MSRYIPFWEWCAARGVTSKRLSIRTNGSVAERGLFLDEDVKAGSVLISVPYRAAINRETLPCGFIPKGIPPLWMFHKVLRRVDLTPHAAEYFWLASVLSLASSSPHFMQSYGPFLEILPAPAEHNALRAATRLTLSQNPADLTVCNDFDDIKANTSKTASLVSRLLRKYVRHTVRKEKRGALCALATAEGIFGCHDTVISRGIDIPWGCKPSAPNDLTTFLEEQERLIEEGSRAAVHAVIPTLVPVIDLINSGHDSIAPGEPADGASETDDAAANKMESQSNCEIFTCQFNPNKGERSCGYRSGSRDVLDKRRIVLCASKDIASGSELLMDYNCGDKAASAFRFGFV